MNKNRYIKTSDNKYYVLLAGKTNRLQIYTSKCDEKDQITMALLKVLGNEQSFPCITTITN